MSGSLSPEWVRSHHLKHFANRALSVVRRLPVTCFWPLSLASRAKCCVNLQPDVWERMFTCDYCFRPVSPGVSFTACVICNVVAHAGCILSAVSAIEETRASSLTDHNGANRGDTSRAADLRPESPGAFLDGDDCGAVSGDEGGDDGVVGCGYIARRRWVCDHCTREHLLQISERGTNYGPFTPASTALIRHHGSDSIRGPYS